MSVAVLVGRHQDICGAGFALSGLFADLRLISAAVVLAGLDSGASSTLLLKTYLARIGDGPVATALSVMNLAAFGTASFSYAVFGGISSAASPTMAFLIFGSAVAISGLAFCKEI